MYIGVIGLILIFGHNAFDGINAENLGPYKLPWMVLHQSGFYQFNGRFAVFLLYPIIPWIGVMALGYYMGAAFKLQSNFRKRLFMVAGFSCLLLFILLRYFNIYGDPNPWHLQSSAVNNVLAFITIQKYPPSLLYLLVTLGVALILLSILEHVNNGLSQIFSVYGRVPMFYYVLHIYIIHTTQVLLALLIGFDVNKLSGIGKTSATWGFNLPIVYLIWILVVASLYYPCRWFMRLKQRRTDWWLSYL